MVNTKGDNQKTLQNLEILFGSVTSQNDSKQLLVFLERYFVYLKQLPEFTELANKYEKEEIDSLKGMEDVNRQLSISVDSEVARIFSKDLIDLDRINTTMNTDWGEQKDDVPRDGETLVNYHTELNKKGGITRYLKLKELIDHVDARQDDILSFICGLHDLIISRECQSSFEEWLKKYNELNPDGQIWWSYKQISKEKSKAFKEINFTKLREYLNVFNEDIKQFLTFGGNNLTKAKVTFVLPDDVKTSDTSTGGYLVTFANNKKLSFEEKDEDSCKCFRCYFERYGQFIDHQSVLDYVNNPKKTINSLVTTLIEKFNDCELGMRIQLKGNKHGSYRLTIKPSKE